VDDGKHFTDLRIEANVSPFKALTLFTDSRFNTYETRFSTIMAGFDLKFDNDNLAGLSYRYSRDRKSGPFTATSIIDPENTSIGDQVDYLDSRVRVNIAKPLIFSYRGRYSFDRGGFLETSYSLEYRHQCWSVELVYFDRPINHDRSFMLNFVLSGLGAIGKYKAF
jgi:LPS-assembly protein